MSDNSIALVWALTRPGSSSQHATDPLTAPNRSAAIRTPEWLNQLVPDALVIPLAMVVGNELGNRSSKMPLP
jgi:hypothetical protein